MASQMQAAAQTIKRACEVW